MKIFGKTKLADGSTLTVVRKQGRLTTYNHTKKDDSEPSSSVRTTSPDMAEIELSVAGKAQASWSIPQEPVVEEAVVRTMQVKHSTPAKELKGIKR